MKGYEHFAERVGSPENLQATLDILQGLSPDQVNKPRLEDWLQEGIDRADGRWEIRSALRLLADLGQPRNYLEIGVRRGWSLAQVLVASPRTQAVGIDIWVPAYGDVPNPGPDFVLEELQALGLRPRVEWISESSHTVLARIISTSRRFDLITVDGDHTGPGATADLEAAYQLLSPGGVIVFDDIVDASDGGYTLREAWERSKRPNVQYVEYAGLNPVGVAFT